MIYPISQNGSKHVLLQQHLQKRECLPGLDCYRNSSGEVGDGIVHVDMRGIMQFFLIGDECYCFIL